jgi:hypothetical protein
VAVADSGVPIMTATQSFSVTVTKPIVPTCNAVSVTNGNLGFWINGDTGPDYIIQASTNLSAWSSIAVCNSPTPPFFWSDVNTSQFAARFYRVFLGP